MKINVNSADWIEIYAGVMMYGHCMITAKQTEIGVELAYMTAPDGSGTTRKEHIYPDDNISLFMNKLAEQELNIYYDSDDEIFYSCVLSDLPSEWCISVGKGSEVITEFRGTALKDPAFFYVLNLLKSVYPFAEISDEFFGFFDI